MLSSYYQRVKTVQNTTEALRNLPPAEIGEGLIAEGMDAIQDMPGSHQQALTDRFLRLVDPLAALEHQHQTERQFSQAVEDWLNNAGHETSSRPIVHDPDAWFIKWAAGHNDLPDTDLIMEIGRVCFEVEFGIKYGYPWNDRSTLRGISQILEYQKNLGVALETDRIRGWLTPLTAEDAPFRTAVTESWIENAWQGKDRASFLVAARRYVQYGIRDRHPLQIAHKLAELAAGFINNPDSTRLDREVINAALDVLPYADRITLKYPFSCGRLGLALINLAERHAP